MRQKIQRRSLTGKNCPGISGDVHELGSWFHKRPIVVRASYVDFRIQCSENLFGNRQACTNQRLPGKNVSPYCSPWRYRRQGRGIAGSHVLRQRAPDKIADVFGIPIHERTNRYVDFASCANRSRNFSNSMRCADRVASSPLIIFSGARLRNVSSLSCFSLDPMAFCKPSDSFFSRTFSAAGSTVSEYATRTSNLAVERTAPVFASNC